jgi:hypothetical protein
MGTGLHGMYAVSVSVCKAAAVGCMGMCREFEYHKGQEDPEPFIDSSLLAYHLCWYSVLEYKCLYYHISLQKSPTPSV